MRRFIAVDDCGVRINPMIVEGQIHGGLAEGVGIALMELIAFDEQGNCLGGSFMDYLIPTALEVPDWELGETVTPSPHHPIGAKGVGESPTVGSPPAIVNAVIDALHEPLGVDHIDMPLHAGARVGGDAGQGGAAAVIGATAGRARARARATARRRSCTATVVRAQRPTSARPGDAALVLGRRRRSRASSAASCAEADGAPARAARAGDRRAAAAADRCRATGTATSRRGRRGHRRTTRA